MTGLVLAMVAPGSVLLRIFRVSWSSRLEQATFGIAMGLAGWVPWTLLVGWALNLHRSTTLLSTGSYLAVSVAAIVYSNASSIADRVRSRSLPRFSSSIRWIDVALVAILLCLSYVSLLGALSPEVQFDARWYHLGSAAHYVSHGQFYNLVASTHDSAMGLNPYQEILYTAFYSLGGQHAAKVFAFLDLPLIALAMVAFGRVHLRSVHQGLLAAVVFLAIPIASWSGATASNDLPVALYSLLAVHMLLRWHRQPEKWSFAYLSLFLAGVSCGIKSFGVFTLIACVFILVVETIRRRLVGSLVEALPICGFSTLSISAACATWWIRIGAMTGDPIVPVAYNTFGTPYWNRYSSSVGFRTYRHVPLAHAPAGFAHSLWATFSNPGPFQVIMGPLFLIAVPIVVATVVLSTRRPTPEWFIIGIVALVWSFAWYVGGFATTRYLVAVMPLACLWIVGGLNHGFSYPRLGRIAAVAGTVGVALVSVTTTQLLLPLQRGASTPGIQGSIPYAWNYLYRGAPEASVQLDYLPMIRFINSHLGSTPSKIYDGAGLYSAYMYLAPEMYNGSTYASPAAMGQWSLSSPDVLQEFRRNGIGYVVATGSTLAKLRRLPLYGHLAQIHESQDGIVLYRVLA